MKIIELRSYTIPMFGNEHVQPYGKLVVSDDSGRVVTAKIMEDKDGNQYITVNKKRYCVRNAGTLYNPQFVFVGSIEDAADKLSNCVRGRK